MKDRTPAESHFTPTYTRYSFSFQPDEMESTRKSGDDIWWNYPEPIFNMYHYSEYIYLMFVDATEKKKIKIQVGTYRSKLNWK